MEDDPEDILSASLQSLYGLTPITFSTAGAVLTYSIKPPHPLAQEQIEVTTPDTDPSNWSLHASSIWVSSLFIADHLDALQIDAMTGPVVHVLELGAGAGLPSILLARTYPHASVTVSDYPDDRLIRTLSDNIRRNGVSERCRAVPCAWGTDSDIGALVSSTGHARFDVVFAADTLWNPELHAPFLDTLCMCLKRGSDSRIHLVAGLHTGRYTIQSFMDRTTLRGLVLLSATEREVDGTQSRPWDVSRAVGEDERERRRWVVWIILKWDDSGDVLEPL
jgi:nicotinamide N-methyltransferase